MQRLIACIVCVCIFGTTQGCSNKEKKDTFTDQVHKFLLHQRNDTTGILESFFNTTDRELKHQASTYDQALAGIGFLELGDTGSAKAILEFFRNKWNAGGLCNFYDTESGDQGVEGTIHLGPNIWVALFAIHYYKRTGDETYYRFAKDIALWAAKLNHIHEGISMGPQKDWGGNWPTVISSENNIVAHSVYRYLYSHGNDIKAQEIFLAQMRGIEKFINSVTLQRDPKGKLLNVSVGSNPVEEASAISSSDVVTMLLLGFNPQELKSLFSIEEDELIEFARNKFFVYADGVQGYDFTDPVSVKKIGRDRMISLEWSAQFADAFCSLAKNHRTPLTLRQAESYEHQADTLNAAIDTKKISENDFLCYPYASKDATQVFPFAPWWKTPQGNVCTCGALSSTIWRLFAYTKLNPLDIRE